jgi:hypothetical protein
MLACKEIVEIVASNQKLSLVRKLELRFHLLMCKHCYAYVEQLKIMNSQYKKVFKKITETDQDHVHQLEDQVIEHIKNIHEKKE